MSYSSERSGARGAWPSGPEAGLGPARVVANWYPGGVDAQGRTLVQVQEHEVTIGAGKSARLVLTGE